MVIGDGPVRIHVSDCLACKPAAFLFLVDPVDECLFDASRATSPSRRRWPIGPGMRVDAGALAAGAERVRAWHGICLVVPSQAGTDVRSADDGP